MSTVFLIIAGPSQPRFKEWITQFCQKVKPVPILFTCLVLFVCLYFLLYVDKGLNFNGKVYGLDVKLSLIKMFSCMSIEGLCMEIMLHQNLPTCTSMYIHLQMQSFKTVLNTWGEWGCSPILAIIGICRPKGYGFKLFWSENGYRFFKGTTRAYYLFYLRVKCNNC